MALRYTTRPSGSPMPTRSVVASKMSRRRWASRWASTRSVMSSIVPTKPAMAPSSPRCAAVRIDTHRTAPLARTMRTSASRGGRHGSSGARSRLMRWRSSGWMMRFQPSPSASASV
ncbi:MAG: hypothetical protein R2699_01135 [Acidimicrobiales bacterium]